MLTVLCLDDSTCGLAEAAQVLRESGSRVLTTDDNAAALNLALETPLDAVLLNCRGDRDNAGLVAALRILQPHAAVLMFSGYCGVPCDQLHLADACFQKGGKPSKLLPLLRAVLCQSRYGLCRSVSTSGLSETGELLRSGALTRMDFNVPCSSDQPGLLGKLRNNCRVHIAAGNPSSRYFGW